MFDPATIADKATYENPHQLSVGIQEVIVNGVPVVHEGKVTSAKPGRAVPRSRVSSLRDVSLSALNRALICAADFLR